MVKPELDPGSCLQIPVLSISRSAWLLSAGFWMLKSGEGAWGVAASTDIQWRECKGIHHQELVRGPARPLGLGPHHAHRTHLIVTSKKRASSLSFIFGSIKCKKISKCRKVKKITLKMQNEYSLVLYLWWPGITKHFWLPSLSDNVNSLSLCLIIILADLYTVSSRPHIGTLIITEF